MSTLSSLEQTPLRAFWMENSMLGRIYAERWLDRFAIAGAEATAPELQKLLDEAYAAANITWHDKTYEAPFVYVRTVVQCMYPDADLQRAVVVKPKPSFRNSLRQLRNRIFLR